MRLEIQVDLDSVGSAGLDHRNLLFWHEWPGQNDAVPREVGDGRPGVGRAGESG